MGRYCLTRTKVQFEKMKTVLRTVDGDSFTINTVNELTASYALKHAKRVKVDFTTVFENF